MYPKIVIIFIILMLTGCVGAWTHFTVESGSGRIDPENKAISSGKKIWPVDAWQGFSKNYILGEFGGPDNIIQKGLDKERWVYPYKTAWRGIYLFVVIIPIPLIAPLGRLNIFVDFDGDLVQEISYEYITGRVYLCGPGFWIMTGYTAGYESMFCGSME